MPAPVHPHSLKLPNVMAGVEADDVAAAVLPNASKAGAAAAAEVAAAPAVAAPNAMAGMLLVPRPVPAAAAVAGAACVAGAAVDAATAGAGQVERKEAAASQLGWRGRRWLQVS